jgi:hypothetical protein
MTPTSIRRFVWGITVLCAGVVLMLQALEILPGFAWKYIWPVFVILIGLELMLTAVFKSSEETEISITRHWLGRSRRKRR